MGKVIFWIVIVFAVLLGLRLLSAGAAKRKSRDGGPSGKNAGAANDTMVRCTNCGVYLPRADALPSGGGFVCGDPACAPPR